jgi:hypothetical protein
MRNSTPLVLTTGLVLGLLTCFLTNTAISADKEKNPIKEAMQKYHKAPKGTDPVSKRVSNGAGTKEELTAMVRAYTAMASAKPPQGDEKSWKEKSTALLNATQALQDGKPGALDQFKTAVNCKACHSVHKPQ